MSRTITLTFGEQSENHVGMKIQGNGLADKGFSDEQLLEFKKYFEDLNLTCDMIDLSLDENNRASVLVIRNAWEGITQKPTTETFNALLDLDWDRHYWDRRRKRVLNKRARWNLCFADHAIEPDYENGQGRVCALKDIPFLQQFSLDIQKHLNESKQFECEGNYYYNSSCGIGWHGDSERKKVVAVRFGSSLPIHWYWYHRSKRQGDRKSVMLNDGDMYIMSEKASGFDWKKSSLFTLRHSTGANKYTQ